jgi:D-alanine transaminase
MATLVHPPAARSGFWRDAHGRAARRWPGVRGSGVDQRKFMVEEAKAAREAFMTAASMLIMPIVRIDGALVADGKPGPIATRLRAAFHRGGGEAALSRW